jgi:CheY-like chemotaxis protein
MTVGDLNSRFVLVLEDVRETATLIRSLLTSSGFRVALAADEEDAITRARAEPPDVVVISLALETEQLIAAADRIRENAGMAEELPIVIFCVPTIPEGSEIEARAKTYLVRLDDFNQLRTLLGRLLAIGSGV